MHVFRIPDNIESIAKSSEPPKGPVYYVVENSEMGLFISVDMEDVYENSIMHFFSTSREEAEQALQAELDSRGE